MDKQDVLRVLMKRDHMNLFEAQEEINRVQKEVDIFTEGCDPMIFEAEHIIKRELNLGPEYLDAFFKW